jgi:pimeloyl-ACP methyl ester carboxylesterase
MKKYPDHVSGTIFISAELGSPLCRLVKNKAGRDSRMSSMEKELLSDTASLRSAVKEARQESFTVANAASPLAKWKAGMWKRDFVRRPSDEFMEMAAGWSPQPGYFDALSAEKKTADPASALTGWQKPMLCFESSSDLAWEPSVKLALIRQLYPKATVVLAKNSGHYIFIEENELFMREVKKFISDHSSSA